MAAFQPCWTTPDGTVCQESLYTEDEVLLYQSTRFDMAHKKKRDKQVCIFFRNKFPIQHIKREGALFGVTRFETRNVNSAAFGRKPSLWLC